MEVKANWNNLYNIIATPLTDHLKKALTERKHPNKPFSGSLNQRVCSASKIIFSPPVAALDFVLSLVFIIRSGLSLGNDKKINEIANLRLYTAGRGLFAEGFMGLLESLNPQMESDSIPNPHDYSIGESRLNSERFFERHVMSRIDILKEASYAVLQRVAFLALGILTVPAALLTKGELSMLNSLAISALSFPQVISDIYVGTLRLINPWAKVGTIEND